MAVCVALDPTVVKKYFKKQCFIETEGKYTKGMVVIDWFDRFKSENCVIVSEVDEKKCVKH